MVREGGFEPPRLTTLASKTSLATFTTLPLNSSAVLLPFLPLQPAQDRHQLSMLWVPPLERGTMCSRGELVLSPQSSTSPQ